MSKLMELVEEYSHWKGKVDHHKLLGLSKGNYNIACDEVVKANIALTNIADQWECMQKVKCPACGAEISSTTLSIKDE